MLDGAAGYPRGATRRCPAPHHRLALGATSLSFNGTNSYIRMPDGPSLQIATNLTAEAWLKPVTVSGHRHLMGKNDWEISIKPLGAGFQVGFEWYSSNNWHQIWSGEYAASQCRHV